MANESPMETLAWQLERLIDRSSLPMVLEALAAVCGEKADHVRTNWQDNALATVWGRAGRQLDQMAARFETQGL